MYATVTHTSPTARTPPHCAEAVRTLAAVECSNKDARWPLESHKVVAGRNTSATASKVRLRGESSGARPESVFNTACVRGRLP